ncbi:MAG: hypothetical protein BWY44_00178 [Candidatus Omnitrophica bacterium ADurb.Bin292]|mgnify:FL=1|jgi:hypothetical protein|nr:MAG: hypothetical protein BWY44_00178 [Candidatus Omnitrophica bacterium ADurb.Bin292]
MISALIKLIFNLIRWAVILSVVALIFHTWTIRQVVKHTLSWQLGAPVEIGSVKMDWKNTGFELHGLEIGNPYHYGSGLMADIPLVIVSLDATKIPAGVFRFRTVGLYLRKLNIIHSPGNGFNVMELKTIKKQSPSVHKNIAAADPEHLKDNAQVVIDEFIISIGDIALVEALTGLQKEKHIKANIQGQTFHNVSVPQDLVYVTVMLAMKKIGYNFAEDQLRQFLGASVIAPAQTSLFEKIKKSFA